MIELANPPQEAKDLISCLVQSDIKFHLDIGSQNGAAILHIPAEKRLFCEASKEFVVCTPTPCFYGDAFLLSRYFSSNLFDLITALDVIEHQSKEDGGKLIEMVEHLGCARIIFSTPLGELWIGEDKREYQTHLSGWQPEEFTAIGYKCLVYPNYHPFCGYFFAIKDLQREFKLPKVPMKEGIFRDGYWVE